MRFLNIQRYITFIIVFFAFAHIVHANFEITEIMYDASGTDTDHEWVEVENTGSSADDLSKWYLFSDNTKHSLTPQGSSMIETGGYAIISQNAAKFRTDYPNFTGALFDSSWTGFNNDGETIALKDPDLNVVSPVTFTGSQGAGGNGNSLQKIDGVWKEATPTPGLPNQASANNTSSGSSGLALNNSSATSTQTSSSQTTKKEIEVPKITTEIIAKNTVFANMSFPVESLTLGYSKEILSHGKFVWNLGDGVTKEEMESKPFDYVYQYPGEYVITLSYYQNYYTAKPDATSRMIIKVVPSEVAISSVGDATDPFVELENKSTYEITLSQWILKGAQHSFIIPDGTVILPNKKLKLSPKVTGFDSGDLESVVLENPAGELFASYPALPIKKSYANNSFISDVSSSQTNSTQSNASSDKSQVIDLNTLEASAGNINTTKSTDTTLPFMGLGGVIVLGLLSAYVIRRKNNIPDYVEKEIRVEDMTIIE